MRPRGGLAISLAVLLVLSAASGLGAGLTKFTIEYAQYALITKPDTRPLGVAAAWVSDAGAASWGLPHAATAADKATTAAMGPRRIRKVSD